MVAVEQGIRVKGFEAKRFGKVWWRVNVAKDLLAVMARTMAIGIYVVVGKFKDTSMNKSH